MVIIRDTIGVISIDTLSVWFELSERTADSTEKGESRSTTGTKSIGRVECFAVLMSYMTISIVISPLPLSTCCTGNTKTIVKFKVYLINAVETLSSLSIIVSTSHTHIITLVIDDKLSVLTDHFTDTFISEE